MPSAKSQGVRRVLCVAALFLLCVTIGCTAQEDELQRSSAVDVKSVDRIATPKAKLALLVARIAIRRIRRRFRQFKAFCDKVTESAGNSEEAEHGIEEYVNNTKAYMQEYTGLEVGRNLDTLVTNLKTARSLRERLRARKVQFCNYSKKFFDKVAAIEERVAKIRKFIADVKAAYSEGKFAELSRETEDIRATTKDLLAKSSVERTAMSEKLASVQESGSVAKRLFQKMKNVFLFIRNKYLQCKQAYKEELIANSIGQTNGTVNVEKLRLRICQRKANQA